MKKIDVTVIPPKFDTDRFLHEAKLIIHGTHPIDIKHRRLRLLIQRIYDMGLQEGKGDENWYEKETQERMRV